MAPDNEKIVALLSHHDHAMRSLCFQLLDVGARPQMIRGIAEAWCQLDNSAACQGDGHSDHRMISGATLYNEGFVLRRAKLDLDALPQIITEQSQQVSELASKFTDTIAEYTAMLNEVRQQLPRNASAEPTAPEPPHEAD